MKYIKALRKFALGAIASTALVWGGVANALPTQLGIAIDGSGSVSSADFAIQKNGLSAAFAALPVDSSVEITLVQFASGAQIEAGPVVIDSLATRDALVASTNAIVQTQGGTNPAAAINALTNAMTGSTSFGGDSIINLSTDGGFGLSSALTSANAAKAAGIDALTAEAIGPGAGTSNLLAMVYNSNSNPNDGSSVLLPSNSAPGNPLTNPAWVVPVTSFTAFGPVIGSKIQAIVGPPTAVPEPGAIALIGIGMLALVFSQAFSRRRRGRDMNMFAAA